MLPTGSACAALRSRGRRSDSTKDLQLGLHPSVWPGAHGRASAASSAFPVLADIASVVEGGLNMQLSRRLPLSGAHLSAHLQRLVEPQGMDLNAPYLADALKAACMRVVESRAEARAFLDSVRRAPAALHPLMLPWDGRCCPARCCPAAAAVPLGWLLSCAWLSGNPHPQRLLPCSIVATLTSEQPPHWWAGLDLHPVCGLRCAAASSGRLPCKPSVAGCLLGHAHSVVATCAASSNV